MAMSGQERIRWALVWLTMLVVAVAAGYAIKARRSAGVGPDGQDGALGRSFRYDVSDLKRTDPKLMIGVEQPAIRSPVAGPHAIAVDEADHLYVGGDREVAELDEKGAVVMTFPVESEVRCLTVDKGGTVYVGHADHVAVYSARGKKQTEWPSLGTNAVLTSLATVGTNVFVADAGNRIVWRLNQQGAVINRIGGKSDDFGGFIIPSPYFDLAIGPGNELWVVDPGRHALMCFSYEGQRQSQWARSGAGPEGFCGCCNPSHIAIRADGSFVTSEKGLVRVKIHAATGELIGVVAGPDQFADDEHGLDLAVDGTGRVLVLDPVRAQIRVFEVKSETQVGRALRRPASAGNVVPAVLGGTNEH